MYVKNMSTGSNIELPFFTLAEKCVWENGEEYLYCAVPTSLPLRELPDAWYKGQVSFDDVLYRVSRDENFQGQEYVWDSGGSGLSFDMHSLTSIDNHIFFIDKISNTLGVINLEDENR
jgi:hypothetical protein